MRRCVALFRLIGPLQKPYRATPHALGIYKAKPFQMYEVVAEGTLGRLGGHFRSELTKGSSFPPSERLEQLALPWSKVVCNAMRCNIGAWKEAHAESQILRTDHARKCIRLMSIYFFSTGRLAFT